VQRKQATPSFDALDGAVDVSSRLGHRSALDGLRAAAVVLVIGNHAAGSHFPGGGLGVDIFFVLSGFLITCLLFEEWHTTGRITIRDFYIRRALRLLPALLLVLLFVFIVPRLLSDVGDVAQFINLRDVVAPLLYVSNWVLMSAYEDPSLMPHAWSLAVEEQFYLIWPVVLVLGLQRSLSVSVLIRWTSALIVVAGTVMAIRAGLGTPSVVLYAGPESRGGLMLLTGAALAFWFGRADGQDSRLARLARFTWIPAAFAIAVLVLTVTQSHRFLYYGGWLVVAALVATLLIAALDETTWLSSMLSMRPLVWLGTVSYGLYLWHVPIILLTANLLKPKGYGSAAVAVVAVPTSILIASLSFYLIERPINRAGRRWLVQRRAHWSSTRSG